jgi:hypothetical protein
MKIYDHIITIVSYSYTVLYDKLIDCCLTYHGALLVEFYKTPPIHIPQPYKMTDSRLAM